jgi:hypothetical protein
MEEVNRLKVRLKRAEVGRSNQNYAAEREIGELKKRWRNRMVRKKVPKRLWDYGLVAIRGWYFKSDPSGKQWTDWFRNCDR